MALERLPEFVTVFQHATSPCAPLGSGMLFRNAGARALRVEGIGVDSPRFGLEGGPFPVALGPGESVPVRIFYREEEDGRLEARVTVATSEGCRGFEVRGLRTSGSLITRTDEAVDFGRVAPGGVSEVRRVSVLLEQTDELISTFSGFGTSPADLFPVVSATSPEATVGVCETRDVEMRFDAPTAAGMFEGALFWEVITDGPDGSAAGLAYVPLYATVAE